MDVSCALVIHQDMLGIVVAFLFLVSSFSPERNVSFVLGLFWIIPLAGYCNCQRNF